MKSTIIKITLWIGIIALAYFGLYGNITNEIKVRKSMNNRIKEIEEVRKLTESRIKSLIKKDAKPYNKLKQKVLYCKYCKTYMTTEEICSSGVNNYKNCKNYKN